MERKNITAVKDCQSKALVEDPQEHYHNIRFHWKLEAVKWIWHYSCLPYQLELWGDSSSANGSKLVNLSVAIIPMSHQFGWNSSTAGLVQSSFFWGYALSQLPGGWLAKLFGGRSLISEKSFLGEMQRLFLNFKDENLALEGAAVPGNI
ncbi:hypothetical protein IEQ34_013393 [Dendrobium chrysotoxum]|uniref:Uncharacterized protein n=1 Tax=Dendrobium chrysotoxum TaxID=161865 RepID=A0AAV7GQV4_DENCH|nr:hypothetical protein IEQ34_013393 [Dendrobium chrysotoxum]